MKQLLFIVSLFASLQLQAQLFNDVSVEDLKESSHSLEESADAAFLYNKNEVKYVKDNGRFSLSIKYKKRIKIYKESGLDFSKFKIWLYQSTKEKEKIESLEGACYNLVNGQVEKEILDQNKIQISNFSDQWKVYEFTIPKVKPGSIIELNYEITTPFIYHIPTFSFQQFVPVDYAEFTLKYPEYFYIATIIKGFNSVERKDSTINKKNYKEKYIKIKSKNLLPLTDDLYVPNINDYRCSIESNIQNIYWPNGEVEVLSEDWKSFGNNLLEDKVFGKQLNLKLKELKPIVKAAKELELEERIQYIYNYVRDNYSWNGENSIYSKGGLKAFIKEKKGNVADMNLLAINLLRRSGIKADPLLIRSRYSGLLNHKYPKTSELEYLIVFVNEGEQKLFLDTTSKLHSLGSLPTRAVSYFGLCVQKNKSKIINYNNPNKYKSQCSLEFEIDEENKSLFGKGKVRMNNFASTKFRMNTSNLDDEDDQDIELIYAEDIEKEKVFNIKSIENHFVQDSQIKYTFEETKFNCIDFGEKEITISADFDYGLPINPFTSDKRLFPVFFNSLNDLRRVFILSVPEDYMVKSIPKDLKIALADNKASFIYEIKNLDNKLLISYLFKINTDFFKAYEYQILNEFYRQLFEKQKERIVLIKKS